MYNEETDWTDLSSNYHCEANDGRKDRRQIAALLTILSNVCLRVSKSADCLIVIMMVVQSCPFTSYFPSMSLSLRSVQCCGTGSQCSAPTAMEKGRTGTDEFPSIRRSKISCAEFRLVNTGSDFADGGKLLRGHHYCHQTKRQAVMLSVR